MLLLWTFTILPLWTFFQRGGLGGTYALIIFIIVLIILVIAQRKGRLFE